MLINCPGDMMLDCRQDYWQSSKEWVVVDTTINKIYSALQGYKDKLSIVWTYVPRLPLEQGVKYIILHLICRNATTPDTRTSA